MTGGPDAVSAFNWKSWRIGLLLVALTSLLTAGAGLVDPNLTWRGFVAVFCSSLLTSLPLYLYKHPVPGLDSAIQVDTTNSGRPQGLSTGTVPGNNNNQNETNTK